MSVVKKVLLGIVAASFFIMLSGFLFVYIFTINKTIESGAGYGFEIGDTKLEVYRKAAKLKNNGEIVGFEVVYPKETYEFIYMPQELSVVKEYFDRWDYWVLSKIQGYKFGRVDLSFKNNTLEYIGKIKGGELIRLETWPEGDLNDSNSIEAGDTYEDVYLKLEKIFESRYPLAKIEVANLSGYKLPNDISQSEFYLVEKYAGWRLRVSENVRNNSISLSFDESDKLIEIHRNRYPISI